MDISVPEISISIGKPFKFCLTAHELHWNHKNSGACDVKVHVIKIKSVSLRNQPLMTFILYNDYDENKLISLKVMSH